MQPPYDAQASKKPTNLSINSDLLARARDLNINLSATLEKALAELVLKQEREQWLKENKLAIDKYNNFVEENGVFSDGLRSF